MTKELESTLILIPLLGVEEIDIYFPQEADNKRHGNYEDNDHLCLEREWCFRKEEV